MPGVQGQWDFYRNLRLKIKHTLSACGTFTPSHIDTESTLPLPLCRKSQMLTQTVQLALSGGANGGGRQPGHVPRPGCAPAVGWPLGGRDSSSQLTKLSQILGTGGCVLLQMSPLILPRQSMQPLVTAVQCQCEVTLAVAAWLSQQPCAKILHTLTTGGMDPRPPPGSALATDFDC